MQIAIRLLWHKQAQFAGYLLAEALSLGKERGIEIRCEGIDFSCSNIDAVLSGKADMAVASPAHVLENTHPHRLAVVLAIQQDSPLVYPARFSSGIAAVSDLAWRKVGVWPGGEDLELRWMLACAGVPEEAVTRVPLADTVQPLLAGSVDCAQMTSYHELHQLEFAAGDETIVVLSAAPLGCSLLKDGLVVARERALKEPDLVQAVVDTVLEGWTIAFEDPERAIRVCSSVRPDVAAEEHSVQLTDIRRLSLVGATLSKGLGYPDPEHARRAAQAVNVVEGRLIAAAEEICDVRFWEAAPPALRRRIW